MNNQITVDRPGNAAYRYYPVLAADERARRRQDLKNTPGNRLVSALLYIFYNLLTHDWQVELESQLQKAIGA
jgi:hypothetical protein